jgi:hypothetical protein
MTIAQFPVPPIVKNVTVRAAPARAFALFADDLARGWPLSRVHTVPDPAGIARSSRRLVGGSSADGRETAWGTVLAYDPPHRLAFSWIVELPAGIGATGRDPLYRRESRRQGRADAFGLGTTRRRRRKPARAL